MMASSAEGSRTQRAWLEHLAILLLYLLITLVATWPLARIMDHAVLGPPGDNLEYVWKMAWFKRALLDLKISPFFHPGIFYPVGYPVALSETTLVHTLLGVPLTALWGEIVSYNLMMLGSFVLSGYGLFVWLKALKVSAGAAFAAGVAFAFCPYRMAHLGAGHLPLMGTGAMALLFWASERFAQRPDARRGWLVGLFYALTALSSWYYAVMVAPFALAYLLWRLRPWRAVWREPGLWRGLLAAGLLAVLLIAPAALPLLRLYETGQTSYDQSLAYVDQWSASPLDLIYPNAMHPWWGAALTDAYYQNINENLIYLGLVTLGLAAVAVLARQRIGPVRLLAVLAVVAMILAMGTTLHFAGKPVYLGVPEGFEQLFSRGMYTLTGRLALNKLSYGVMQRPGAIPVPLPTLLLYLYLPFVSAMRVWSRFALLAILFASALAGLGLDLLLQRQSVLQQRSPYGKVYHYLGVAAATLLILCDFAVLPYAYGYTMVEAQPLDHWLARQAHPSPVIQYPLDKTWYGWMLYPEQLHGQPLAYGYGTFVPQAYAEQDALLRAWPSEDTLALLRRWGVRYVVVGARSYGEQWPSVQQGIAVLSGVALVAEFEDQQRYFDDRLLRHVSATADVPATELINGPLQAYLDDHLYVYAIQ